jgi:hypothetical protein
VISALKNPARQTALLFTICIITLSSACIAFGQQTTPTETTPTETTPTPPPTYEASWVLIFDGAVHKTLSLSVVDLAALPKTEIYAPIYCDGNLVTEGTWGGVLVSYLINQASLSSGATTLEFHAYDGYTVKVAAATASQEGFMVAYEMDGQPLNEHLRLVLPGRPGNFWINQITEISATGSTDYDVGPYRSPSLAPTMKPLPTSPFARLPTATPTQQPTPTPEPTMTPAESTPTITPTLQTSSQLADQQMPQEPSPAQDPTVAYGLLVLAVIVTIAIGTYLLLFKRREKTTK